jgi:hypothetical protein
MTTIKNNSGSKLVRITTDATNSVRAAYCQVYQNEEQVLQFKTFASVKTAEKWANKILN